MSILKRVCKAFDMALFRIILVTVVAAVLFTTVGAFRSVRQTNQSILTIIADASVEAPGSMTPDESETSDDVPTTRGRMSKPSEELRLARQKQYLAQLQSQSSAGLGASTASFLLQMISVILVSAGAFILAQIHRQTERARVEADRMVNAAENMHGVLANVPVVTNLSVMITTAFAAASSIHSYDSQQAASGQVILVKDMVDPIKTARLACTDISPDLQATFRNQLAETCRQINQADRQGLIEDDGVKDAYRELLNMF